MDLRLAGKRAIITGGTRGIGRAIAETLAGEGVQVAVCGRDAGKLDETVTALTGKGVDAYGAVVDVADDAALKAWIAESAHKLGGIDIVVANPSAFALGASEQDWRRGFEVDLLGSVRVIETAVPWLEQAAQNRGDAAIVMIASVAAAETDFDSAYGATKAAVIHYTKGVARRLAAKHIRANVISPGTIYVRDGFWHNVEQFNPQLYATYLQRNPTGRMGTAQEIASVAAFLASPCASFTTGANIVVDGALTARVNF
jgi:3-oxoacyl-[acyl-carrier protein] reductase